MTLSSRHFPALELFLGAYLHQDWQDDYASTESAFTDYLAHEPDLANKIAAELEAVVGSDQDEAALDAFLRDAGSYYLPSLHGLPARPWLAGLLRMCPATDGEEG